MISGLFLAYLPVQTYLKQPPGRLAAWLAPLLAGICLLEGGFCYFLNIPTSSVLFPTLLVLMLIYHKSLTISIWKSGSIFLAVCAVFACVNSLSRAVNAIVAERLGLPETEIWFHTSAGIFYNVICLLFVAAAWYPASHAARTMIDDENLAQTWYVFWILPLIFIGLNLFMIPKYEGTLYTGRILQGYIVISLMRMFFYTLTQGDELPGTILFMNAGVKLPTLDAQVAEHLNALQERGVKVLVCGTCLNFYGLADQLKAGTVSNMYDIVSCMARSAKVVTL